MQNRRIDIPKRKVKAAFRRHRVFLAYVFGSIVSAKTTATSDVDIAVLLDQTLSKEERFNTRLALMGELATLLHRAVDVVVLNDLTSLFFKYVIVHDGKVLYEKNEDVRVEFEVDVLTQYFDFQPFLDLYSAEYVKTHV